MKECPKCHKVYNDNLNFCIVDGSKLTVQKKKQITEKQENAIFRFLKSRGLRWVLLIATALFFFRFISFFYDFPPIFSFWIIFFALLITLIVLSATLIRNRSTKRAFFGLAAAFAIGFASYSCYYYYSATYLIVSQKKIVLPNEPDKNRTFIHIDIDCDGPWRVTNYPSWLELTEYNYRNEGAIMGTIYNPNPLHGYITVKSGRLTKRIEITRN